MTLAERLKTPVTVDVTQKDIDMGLRCCTWGCPIALAVSRALDKLMNVNVDMFKIVVGEGRARYYAGIPDEAQRFINVVDFPGIDTGETQPFEFTVQFELWKEWSWLLDKAKGDTNVGTDEPAVA